MRTLLIISALILNGCLAPSSSSPVSLAAKVPETEASPILDEPLAPVITPAPASLSLTSLSGKTLTASTASISFNGNLIHDSVCGHYEVTGASESSGVLTVQAKRVYPAGGALTETSCMIPIPRRSIYQPLIVGCNRLGPGVPPQRNDPEFATFTLEMVSGALAVNRSVVSPTFHYSCEPPYYPETYNMTLPEVLFYE